VCYQLALYGWAYPGGVIVAQRFHMGGDAFFVAGLWEESPEYGGNTMLTAELNREVAATGHDRCLVACNKIALVVCERFKLNAK
jgi:hypothetical protein